MGKTLDRRRDFTGAAAEFERALDQADLLRLQYECTRCAAKHRQWVDRCENCGEWNTVAIDLKEDRPVEELGLSPTPVYTAS
jgi:lipopolysaccharide biosynthesis regulator YciM